MLLLMPVVSTPASVVYAFQQSDNFARLIVVLLLLISVQVWVTMLEKGVVMGRARRANKAFLVIYRRIASPLDSLNPGRREKGPLWDIYQVGLHKICELLEIEPPRGGPSRRQRWMPRPLETHELEQVRNAMERCVSSRTMALEERLGLLGTAVTISPFLGLLGTVWGVMRAFVGMAQQGRPDIQAMAPGVSGALLTTVVGLVVAIPAVVGFNLITNSVRKRAAEMDDFVDDFVELAATGPSQRQSAGL